MAEKVMMNEIATFFALTHKCSIVICEIVVCIFDTLDNNSDIDIDFTKYLKKKG